MESNIIYTLISLFPIIDVITALQTRSGALVTLGVILKGLLVLFLTYYMVFKSTSKYKKISIAFLILCGFYVIAYFGFKPELLQKAFIMNELIQMFKLLFMPITFFGLLNYFDEFGFDKNKFIKVMKLALIEYTLLLLIPYFTGTAYKTYSNSLIGFDGWFYSGNEVSVIVIMLLPFIYYFIDKRKKFNIVIALPILFAISLIGTKVSLLGTFIITGAYFLFTVFKNKFKINTETVSTLFVLIITILFFVFVNPITIANTKKMAVKRHFIEQTTEIVKTKEEEKEVKPVVKESKPKETVKKETKTETTVNYGKFLDFILSTRNKYFERTLKIYNNTFTYDYIFTGMGFSNTDKINSRHIEKFIEIDVIDLYFHNGVVGLIICLTPVVAGCFVILIGMFKKRFFTNLLCGITLGLFCAISCLSGHLFFYPAPALYLILYLIYIYGFNLKFEKEKLDYNKIQILALHLNQGGIETALTNQANMLADKYNVEIVSLYNSHKDIPYALNKNIKVTYLMNTISNRNEIKLAKDNKDIFKLIKELFKSIKILILKPYLLRKHISRSNAGMIISTRSEFSIILGRFKRKGVITISEEHVYHANNKKRIRLTKKGNKHIDYLLPTSKELSAFYKPIVSSRVEYIPNVINNFPKTLNKLNNKKLLAVGRLSSEKGFIDLIPIMKEIIKKDKEVTLDIYGEGPEKNNILKAIKDNKLDKHIFLKGFVSLNELNNLRKDYSLMLIPSYEESFGLAALESMAFGIPCVAYDNAKGLQEFITNDNGRIIENRDYKEFSKQVLNLLQNKKEIKELSKNARSTAEEYSYDKVKDTFVSFINNIISNKDRLHRKVMFISSTGGHFNELTQLKKMFDMYDYEIVTEKDQTNANLKSKYFNKVHFLLYGTRFHPLPYFLFILPMNCFISLFYYIKYRPEFIITTGAHTAGPMCCIGKIFGSKIIYIETFANSLTKTATGKIVYKFADLFIVQWETMLDLYPDATFGGWIF